MDSKVHPTTFLYDNYITLWNTLPLNIRLVSQYVIDVINQCQVSWHEVNKMTPHMHVCNRSMKLNYSINCLYTEKKGIKEQIWSSVHV